MHVTIEIERPVLTAVTFMGIASAVAFVISTGGSGPLLASAPDVGSPSGGGGEFLAGVLGGAVPPSGGDEVVASISIRETEEEIRRARLERSVLEHREDILRYQIRALEERRALLGGDADPELTMQFRMSVRMLSDLLQNKSTAERKMQESFRELWEAEQRGLRKASDLGLDFDVDLLWPVAPEYGISAGYLDEEYEAFFGIAHNGIDIPALQGTTIVAADDGVVEEVVDNGLGFSWVTVRHEGFVTLYGHVSEALVTPGRYVWKGDPIARSGGMPGTPGAGSLSTGPHLHFELMMQAGNVDPLHYLPDVDGVEVSRDW